jgi:pyrimidine-specific ribonucleoside hydrolase
MESTIDIWLDCDPGHDDMMAILLACNHPKIHLLGISSTAGNKPLDLTTTNALKTLYMIGEKEIPVIRGMDQSVLRGKIESAPLFGDSGLDGAHLPEPTQKPIDENFFLYLRKKILDHPRKLTLVATGPFTNFALLLRVFPEIKPKIEQIVCMGGAIGLGNVTPAAEFNVFCDPEAAKMLVDHGLPIVFIPLDVTTKVLFTSKIKERFAHTGTPFVKALGDLLSFFEAEGRKWDHLDGGAMHDPCTIAYLINPKIFTVKDCFLHVETGSGHCDGRTCCEFHPLNGKFNAKFACEVDPEAFWSVMIPAILEADKKSPLNEKK